MGSRAQGVLKRGGAVRAPIARVLIVCEGSKTEPVYFRELRDHYELPTASVRVTGDCGSDPLSVVKYGEKLFREENKKGDGYDRVFCVFDRDSHQTYDAAIDRIRQLRPANVFFAIPSIPCFEYWYLLHYRYTTQQFMRVGAKSPADCLISLLKRDHWDGYEKAEKGVFMRLLPMLSDAIAHSKRALIECAQNETDHPSTRMHEAVEFLQGLKRRAA